jgi:hypothetical protein
MFCTVLMKEQTNVTLSLLERLFRHFRVFAASRNQSMSGPMTLAVCQMIDQEA